MYLKYFYDVLSLNVKKIKKPEQFSNDLFEEGR